MKIPIGMQAFASASRPARLAFRCASCGHEDHALAVGTGQGWAMSPLFILGTGVDIAVDEARAEARAAAELSLGLVPCPSCQAKDSSAIWKARRQDFAAPIVWFSIAALLGIFTLWAWFGYRDQWIQVIAWPPAIMGIAGVFTGIKAAWAHRKRLAEAHDSVRFGAEGSRLHVGRYRIPALLDHEEDLDWESAFFIEGGAEDEARAYGELICEGWAARHPGEVERRESGFHRPGDEAYQNALAEPLPVFPCGYAQALDELEWKTPAERLKRFQRQQRRARR